MIKPIMRTEHAWFEYEGEHWSLTNLVVIFEGDKEVKCVRLETHDYKAKPDMYLRLEDLPKLPIVTLAELNRRIAEKEKEK